MLHADKVVRVMRSGSSRPMLVEASDGGRYLLKPHGSLSNPLASVSEFLCGKLGVHAGLPVSNPGWIRFSADTDVWALDDEMCDVALKSWGVNVAYDFVEDATDVRAGELELSDPLLRQLFVFDLILLNVDRTPYNVNLLKTPAGALRSFDYETSMLVLGAAQQRTYEEQEFVARALRQSPLYQPDVTENEVVELLNALQTLDLKTLLAELPNPDVALARRFETALTAAFASPIRHLQLLERARQVHVENEAERRARQLENRRKFELEFNKNRPS